MRIREGLFQRAQLRAAQTKGEDRHASWLELFADLAFVAAIGRVGALLVDDYSLSTLLTFSLFFVPIWWTWTGMTFYLSRFDADDLSHRLSGLAHIALVVMMAVAVPSAIEGHIGAFVGCYAALRALLIVQYFVAGKHNPVIKPLVNQYVRNYSIALVIWLGSLFVPAPYHFIFWGVSICFDMFAPLAMRHLHVKFPPNESHVPERLGLFTIIVLGEAIIATVAAQSGHEWTLYSVTALCVGLMMAFAVWWVYFEGVRGADSRIPKSLEEVARYTRWFFSHLPLQAGIVICAIGIEHILHLDINEALHGVEPYLFAGSVLLMMTSLHFIYNSSLDREKLKDASKVWFPHLIVTIATVVVVFFAGVLTGFALLCILTGLFFGHVLLTFRDLSEYGQPKMVLAEEWMDHWRPKKEA